jgi:cell division protein FtsB
VGKKVSVGVQAADVSKLHNEVTMLRKKLAGTENTLAKQSNDLKAQVTNLKTKLAQTERDLIDSQIKYVLFSSFRS